MNMQRKRRHHTNRATSAQPAAFQHQRHRTHAGTRHRGASLRTALQHQRSWPPSNATSQRITKVGWNASTLYMKAAQATAMQPQRSIISTNVRLQHELEREGHAPLDVADRSLSHQSSWPRTHKHSAFARLAPRIRTAQSHR